jgi:peptidoglycan/LPS O-acetylase OafA/YrhL
MSRYQHIDSLRGVAILMVIATHLGPALQETPTYLTVYGRMGVQLFFVVSALTLCLSMEKRKEERYPVSNFFIRRYFRIAPMYIVGVILYSPLVLNYSPTVDVSNLSYLFHLTLLHGFTLDAFKTVVPGGWSIGVEFIFYLLFPIIFALVINKGTKTKFVLLLVIFIGLSLIQSTFFQVYFPSYSSVWKYGYWAPLNQLPVFMVGLMLYRKVKQTSVPDSITSHLAWFLVATLSSLGVWQLKVPFYVVLVPLLSAYSFYHLYFVFESVTWLNCKLLRRIGQLSFSMYLLHFLSISIVMNIEVLDGLRGGGVISLLAFYLLVIILTMALSVITEKVIELKFVALAKKIITMREHKNSITVLPS